MTVPDTSMASSVPSGIANGKTLQQGSPALYALVSDTESAGHALLPAVMPTGSYTVISDAATASSGALPDSSGRTPGAVKRCTSAAQTVGAGSAVMVTMAALVVAGLVH
jgi:hypothetical protein